MESQIETFEYSGRYVEFDLSSSKLMVNATAMAKIFNRNIKDFMRNDSTITFIKECLKRENSPFLGIEKEDDLYVSRQRTGTWMHRILALKFAAWLDAGFELWVYYTIDQILFGKLREQERRATDQAAKEVRRQELEAQFAAMPEFSELQSLRAGNSHYYKQTRQQAATQLDMFTEKLRPREGKTDQ